MGNSERVEVIDSLRGIAAFAVVLYHYVGFIPLMNISVGPFGSVLISVTRYGYLGVPVFFVLSGFVIAMTASRYTFNANAGCRFVRRRLVRLVPPYWAMIVLIAVAVIAGQAVGLFKSTVVTPGQVAAHWIYAQELLGFPPLDVAYWTLCLEVQFYLAFAASMVVLHRCGDLTKVGWFTVLTAGSLLIDVYGVTSGSWFPRLWYQFGVGVLTFQANRNRAAQFALSAILITLFTLGMYQARAANITIVLVAGLLLCRDRSSVAVPARHRLLLGLGQISYSLYLVHGLIGMVLAAWFRSASARSEMASWCAITAATVMAIASAAVFYYVCERRAVEWSRRLRV